MRVLHIVVIVLVFGCAIYPSPQPQEPTTKKVAFEGEPSFGNPSYQAWAVAYICNNEFEADEQRRSCFYWHMNGYQEAKYLIKRFRDKEGTVGEFCLKETAEAICSNKAQSCAWGYFARQWAKCVERIKAKQGGY